MNIRERIKIISAILLIICVALPISSCSRYVDSNGKIIARYDPKIHVNAKRITTYNYLFERFNPKDSYIWLLLLCFIWPIPIMLYRYKGTKKLIKNILWGIEPIFAVGASYYIWIGAHFFGKPFIGAYFAISANSIYAITWFSELLLKIIHKTRHRS
jgi:hypothetical protein